MTPFLATGVVAVSQDGSHPRYHHTDERLPHTTSCINASTLSLNPYQEKRRMQP
ncbi:hypothetical protein [Dickeya zeae]|uniref:hypothetical protein n=1 Tax=Dickeya zeae TaxID=204042 RepID=UPI0014433641|nr:hypothetical protein [Dickeya zeae]